MPAGHLSRITSTSFDHGLAVGAPSQFVDCVFEAARCAAELLDSWPGSLLSSAAAVSGDFDDTVPAQWLLWASLALGRATEDEVKAGRMTIEQATRAMYQGLLRLLGVTMHRAPGAVAEARGGRGYTGR